MFGFCLLVDGLRLRVVLVSLDCYWSCVVSIICCFVVLMFVVC